MLKVHEWRVLLYCLTSLVKFIIIVSMALLLFFKIWSKSGAIYISGL